MDKVKLVENSKVCIRNESLQMTEVIRKLDDIVKWINEHEGEFDPNRPIT